MKKWLVALLFIIVLCVAGVAQFYQVQQFSLIHQTLQEEAKKTGSLTIKTLEEKKGFFTSEYRETIIFKGEYSGLISPIYQYTVHHYPWGFTMEGILDVTDEPKSDNPKQFLQDVLHAKPVDFIIKYNISNRYQSTFSLKSFKTRSDHIDIQLPETVHIDLSGDLSDQSYQLSGNLKEFKLLEDGVQKLALKGLDFDTEQQGAWPNNDELKFSFQTKIDFFQEANSYLLENVKLNYSVNINQGMMDFQLKQHADKIKDFSKRSVSFKNDVDLKFSQFNVAPFQNVIKKFQTAPNQQWNMFYLQNQEEINQAFQQSMSSSSPTLLLEKFDFQVSDKDNRNNNINLQSHGNATLHSRDIDWKNFDKIIQNQGFLGYINQLDLSFEATGIPQELQGALIPNPNPDGSLKVKIENGKLIVNNQNIN